MKQWQCETVAENQRKQPPLSKGAQDQDEITSRSQTSLFEGISTRASDTNSATICASRLANVAPSRESSVQRSLLQLQQRYGNRYVQRVVSLARQESGESQAGPEVESVIERERGGGQQMELGVRRQMESAFGSDFGGVRIHTGPQAHLLNRAVNAVAFTTSKDIFFSEGAYSPSSSDGKQLLAHELTHVVQQGAAPASGKAQRLVQRMCPACEEEKKTKIQGKLAVGAADDQYEREADRVAKSVTADLGPGVSARAPAGGGKGDEIDTVNWKAVGIGALVGGALGGLPGAVVGGIAGGAIGADAGTGSNSCSVTSGPTYTPSGTIPVTTSGGRKMAPFSFAATFDSGSGKSPSCCEVHQFIKWDRAFHTANGGPPHSGFPSGAAADTWIEDRDQADKRYGHRSDSFSDPIGNCGDEYKTGGARDQANGDTYCGKDAPQGSTALTGQWQFRLDAVDTCNGNAVKASSPVITINW